MVTVLTVLALVYVVVTGGLTFARVLDWHDHGGRYNARRALRSWAWPYDLGKEFGELIREARSDRDA